MEHLFYKLNNDLNDLWRGDKEMFDIYFFILILFSILFVIYKGLGYTGWRHLYFIFPASLLTFTIAHPGFVI